MPQHVRSQIADRVVANLTGLPTTATRVHRGRTRTLGAEYDPTLLVYVRREQSDTDTQGRSKLYRIASALIEGRAQESGADAAEELDKLLDLIAAEVEPAMVNDPTLGGLVHEVTLVSSELEVIAPGDVHEGRILLQYRIAYRTTESNPTAAA